MSNIIEFPKPYNPSLEAVMFEFENASALFKYAQQWFNHKDLGSMEFHKFARERLHLAIEIKHNVYTQQLIIRGRV